VFIDRLEIEVAAGRGGNGAVAFRREKYVPKGGPSGGDGGRGGSVVLEVDPSLATLRDFTRQPVYRAPAGGDGGPALRHGKDGTDLVLAVPPGTVVTDAADGRPLADLVEAGERWLAARGGRGGRGNARFASPVQRAPRIAERGAPGEVRRLRLELRLIADAALVGLPNAGKSSLLGRAAETEVRVGPYPFTTVEPELGVLRVGEDRLVLADLPGLVEGAHEGRGLGLEFLRHASRTRCLLQVVDASGLEGRPVAADLEDVDRELALYDAQLAALPRLVVANKVDLAEARENLPAIARWAHAHGHPWLAVSAATGEGLAALWRETARMARSAPPPQVREVPAGEERLVLRPDSFTVVREGSAYVVRGAALERRVSMTDLSQAEAVHRLDRFFRRQGVEEAVRRLGGRDGDVVRIGEAEFVLEPATPPAGGPARR
jgi:GTP-binding protein